MLAHAVSGGRVERSVHLRTMSVATVILGAGADTDHSLTTLVGKSVQQMHAGLDPTKVFRSCPVLSRHGIPGTKQQVRWSYLSQQGRDLLSIQKIGSVPAHSWQRCRRRMFSRRHRVHLVALR